jgi:hypothetical protein
MKIKMIRNTMFESKMCAYLFSGRELYLERVRACSTPAAHAILASLV